MKKTNLIFLSLLFTPYLAFANGVDRAMDLGHFGEIERAIPEYSELEYYGSQMGMYYGYKDEIENINSILSERADSLDMLYNFRNLLLKDNLLPPVVVKGKDLYEQIDKDSYHETSIIYRIRKPSRLSYNSPTWRDYIYLNPEKLVKPLLPEDMRPKNRKAKSVWEMSVKDGYSRGEEHAKSVFSLFLAELNEDFNGMVLAHHLHELNMLNISSIRKMNKGTIVTDKEINVNDRIVRLDPNDVFIERKQWKPHLKVHTGEGG